MKMQTAVDNFRLLLSLQFVYLNVALEDEASTKGTYIARQILWVDIDSSR